LGGGILPATETCVHVIKTNKLTV